MPEKPYCCSEMNDAINDWKSCERHTDPYDCPDALIVRDRDGEHGIIIHDGGSSRINIRFCPWCGTNIEPED